MDAHATSSKMDWLLSDVSLDEKFKFEKGSHFIKLLKCMYVLPLHFRLLKDNSMELNSSSTYVSNTMNANNCSYFVAFVACLVSSAILAVTLVTFE